MSDQIFSTSALAVAVTGSTGFIGARLVEMLGAAEVAARVRVLSRRRVGSAEGVDFNDPGSVRAALADCRVVVHCAFDFADMKVNLPMTQVLAEQCAAVGARLVYVSTAAVYEPFPDGTLDETMVVDGPGSEYKQVKLAIERELLGQVKGGGLDAVILQPTVVYGPQGRAWTDSPIRELLTGTVVLPGGGGGLCNAVYIDDVCRAIIAAATADMVSGERVLVSGPAPVAWREFYGAYQEMLGLDAMLLEPGVASAAPIPEAASGASALKRVATRALGARRLSQVNLAINYAVGLVRGRRHVASGAKLALFQSRCHVRIDKARRLLGYEPAFDLARGMAATRPYIVSTYGRLARLKARR